MNKRTLTLRKETLVVLTADQLADVEGGHSGGLQCVPTADGTTCLAQTLTACPDFYCTGTC